MGVLALFRVTAPEPVLQSVDAFPTATPKPVPLTSAEEELVRCFMTCPLSFPPFNVTVACMKAMRRALEVAGAERDRLGDALVAADKQRRQAEREREDARALTKRALFLLRVRRGSVDG